LPTAAKLLPHRPPAKRLGMRTIAVYSAAVHALHRGFDEAYFIGPAEPRESYSASNA
jgi:acetyl/propionyl-CoA carboxylase alpha subunit